jgi:divalent metal cation (Fe/Co/Zn/Cd) transporter
MGEQTLADTPGVHEVRRLRLRWVGHDLVGEAVVTVDDKLTLRQAHDIAEQAEHRLVHALPRMQRVTIHVDPAGARHATIGHHPGAG